MANKLETLLKSAFERVDIAKKEMPVIGQKHDPTVTPSGPYGHDVAGLFARPGQEPKIFSMMMLPKTAFLDSLPVMKDQYAEASGFGGKSHPLNTVITGLKKGDLDDISNQPTEACDDGPEGGLLKICTFTHPYGAYLGGLSIDLEKVGMQRDYADPTYLQLVNNPTQLVDPAGVTGPTLGAGGSILVDEFALRLFRSVASYKRMLSRRVWVGDPTNSIGSQNWADITGLDILINAGNKRDFLSGAVCSAADSDIKAFGYGIVHPDNSLQITRIFQMVDAMFHYLHWNSREMGLDPAEIEIVMHPNLFDEITKIWPIARYVEALAAMANFAGGRLNVEADNVIGLKESLREQSVLPIRGRMVKVIQDNTIPEQNSTNNANLAKGTYASDIYFNCRSVMGGVPTCYIDPFDLSNRLLESIINRGNVRSTFTTDGGMFRWYVKEKNNCIQWTYKSMWRLMQHATQLCGRITNVGYMPVQHVRDWDPDSDYFKNGGITGTEDQPYYQDWAGATPR